LSPHKLEAYFHRAPCSWQGTTLVALQVRERRERKLKRKERVK